MELINQPTKAPTRKLAYTGLAGAIVTAVLGIGNWDLDPEVVSALTTIVAFIAGYFVKERA